MLRLVVTELAAVILERGYLTGLGLRAGAGGLWALLRAWSAGSAFFEEKTLLETFFNVRLFCVALHLFCGGGVGHFRCCLSASMLSGGLLSSGRLCA